VNGWCACRTPCERPLSDDPPCAGAAPNTVVGRTSLFRRWCGKVWNRRVSLLAVRGCEGRLAEPTATARLLHPPTARRPKDWLRLPPDQRAAVGDAFSRYMIASYVANFDTYSRQRFEVAPVVRAAGSDRVVETQIAAASGQGSVLDYVMRQESGGWKVVDVLVDGAISRVAAQRSEMRSMLADSGGAGLLVGLRQKTADLSGGILQ
jgi:hypothetical protein